MRKIIFIGILAPLFLFAKESRAAEECPETLPAPIIEFTGTQKYLDHAKTPYVRYQLKVTNSDEFPNAMFSVARDLPPCGLNKNASRSWVNIFSGDKQPLYGFCALKSSSSLRDLWFGVREGEPAPPKVYIVINDRKCHKEYKSNEIEPQERKE